MKGASEELLSLIGDLLELTALKRGSIAAMVTEIDPRQPLHDAVATAKGRREQVVFEISEPDIVPSMRSDRLTIAKALKALLNNAFKFTHKGRVRLAVEVTEEQVVYSVEDTGLGIPPDEHERIFERFARADVSRSRREGGVGLGLSIAAAIARAHGGSCAARSGPDGGAVFELRLPLRNAAHAEEASEPGPPFVADAPVATLP